MAAQQNMGFSDVETFLDSHPELFEDYLLRKGSSSMVDKWLKNQQASKSPSAAAAAAAAPAACAGAVASVEPKEEKSGACKDSWASKCDGLQRRASQKELRKTFARSKAINVNRTYDEHVNSRAQEPLTSMRRRALLRKASSLPPTTAHILSALLESRVNIPQYPSTAVDFKYYLKEHNEREFFLELVKDISNDLDLTSLSYKILVFVCIMVDADRCSLFLVEGTGNKKTLVSKFFDVHAGTTVLPSMNSDEVQVPWGKGIIGYVAEHGETVNIPDAYQVPLLVPVACMRFPVPVCVSMNESLRAAHTHRGRDRSVTYEEKCLEMHYANFLHPATASVELRYAETTPMLHMTMISRTPVCSGVPVPSFIPSLCSDEMECSSL